MSTHPVVHIEISADNLVETSHFYSELFGWKTEQIPAMNYVTFAPASGPGGGFNPVSKDAPAGTVLVYFDSDDIEADLSKAVRLGGKVVAPKTEIPGMGWFGIFSDPTGNKLALYTASSPQAM
jgi:predicted enzyme related to lactoylglutathione lyase